jgi:uncharacterized protein YqjF (DUF2071 family)
MAQSWSDVTFVHWRYPIPDVAALLPDGLTVEPWDGAAWVSLVLLRMRVRPPGAPQALTVATFPETNVRTYVVGPTGEPGIWFFSLDAGHLAAVLAARLGWGLPYFWADMRIEQTSQRLRYVSRRHGVVLTGGRHDVVVEPGAPIPRDDVTAFDDYLTARFTLWHMVAGRLARTPADHPPWQLRRADVPRCEQTLLRAAGLPEPVGDPVAHYSPGVDVKIGPLRLR